MTSEPNGRHVIRVADLTLKQLDDMQRLVRQYKWGQVVAMTYVYLRATDPNISRAQVEALRSGDVQIIKDPADDAGDEDSGDEAPATGGGEPLFYDEPLPLGPG